MIVMLGYSELNIEVSDIDIKTTESDNYRGLSKDDRDTNGVLAVIWEKLRFSYKDKQKFIDPFIQLISGLYWVSQLYSRTKEQEESSGVT